MTNRRNAARKSEWVKPPTSAPLGQEADERNRNPQADLAPRATPARIVLSDHRRILPVAVLSKPGPLVPYPPAQARFRTEGNQRRVLVMRLQGARNVPESGSCPAASGTTERPANRPTSPESGRVCVVGGARAVPAAAVAGHRGIRHDRVGPPSVAFDPVYLSHAKAEAVIRCRDRGQADRSRLRRRLGPQEGREGLRKRPATGRRRGRWPRSMDLCSPPT